MKIFSKLFTRSKRRGASAQSTEIKVSRWDHSRFRVPIGQTPASKTPLSAPQDMEQFRECIIQSELFALGCGGTVHEP